MNIKTDVIAIMGGSFNPIHNGHISVGIAAHKQFDLNRILVMPSFNPSSYKDTSELVNPTHRCNMVLAATRDYPYMELSTLEIERGGRTYTADTLRQLKESYEKIYFIIGADSLFALDRWYQPDYVMKNCHFLVANRDQHRMDELEAHACKLRDKFDAKIDFIQMSDIPISSSDIRNGIKNGTDISDMVPQKVYDYICNHNLYRNLENHHE